MRRDDRETKLSSGGGFASLISGLTRRERRTLHESVKRMIMREGDGTDNSSDKSDASAVPAPAPAASATGYAVGAKIMSKDGRDPLFVKTNQGWKATLRITKDDVLKFVKEDSKQLYSRQIDKTPTGSEIVIDSSALISSSIANSKLGADNVLIFKKEADGFADPTVIPEDRMEKIANSLDLTLPAKEGSAETEVKQGTYYIGNVKVEIGSDSATMYIPNDDDFSGFDEIFGRGSKAAKRVKEALAGRERSKGLTVKLPTKGATASSLIYKIDKKAWFGDKIPFTLDDKGEFWVASTGKVKSARGAESELQQMIKTGQAAGQQIEEYRADKLDSAPDGSTFMILGDDNRTKNYLVKNSSNDYQALSFYTLKDLIRMMVAGNARKNLKDAGQGTSLILAKNDFKPRFQDLLTFDDEPKDEILLQRSGDDFHNNTRISASAAKAILDKMAADGQKILISRAAE